MPTSPFDPLTLGSLTLANRLMLAPVKTALGGPDAKATQRHVDYYRRRAAGGVGLVITEPLFIDPRGKEHPKQLGIDTDDKVAGLRSIVEGVRREGGKVFAHLNHAGRAANPKAAGSVPEAPSALTCPSTGATPEALSTERIQTLIAEFGDAVRRAAEAGFDGVEVQFGLGYLVAQFLSPRTNQRADAYGGERGRWRFAQQVAEAVRANLGDGMVWTIRVSVEERVDGGLGLDDAIALVDKAGEWGAVGAHAVTGSACDSPPWYYQHMSLPDGANEALASKLRAGGSLPVFVAGRMGQPARIREVIAGGIDAVALGRPLLADPDLPNKMREERDEQIQACGACLQGCLARVKSGGPIGCIVNPEVGHEDEPVVAAQTVKNVVVVGGGPAGLQAAITSRRRGHRVTLLDSEHLGGQFSVASLAPGKAGMEKTLTTLIRRTRLEGVDVRTGVTADVETVMALSPDEVIVATGSEAATLPVPGLQDASSGVDVLTGRTPPGKRALVVGGGLVGIEVAEFLAERGVPTVVVEMLDEIARDMEPVTRKLTMMRLQKMPVTIHKGARITKIVEGEAFIQGEGQGEGQAEASSLGTFDRVVVAVGNRSVDLLSEKLRERGVSVHVAGDAVAPGQVWDATQAGYRVARSL